MQNIKTMKQIDDLPDKLLTRIIRLLPVEDLLRNIPTVCRKWHSIQSKLCRQKRVINIRGNDGNFIEGISRSYAFEFVQIRHFDLCEHEDQEKSLLEMGLAYLLPAQFETENRMVHFVTRIFPNIRQFSFYGNINRFAPKTLFNSWNQLTHLRLLLICENEQLSFWRSQIFWNNIPVDSLKNLTHLSVVEHKTMNNNNQNKPIQIVDRVKMLMSQLIEFEYGLCDPNDPFLLFDLLNLLNEKCCKSIGIGFFFGINYDQEAFLECQTILKVLHRIKPWISERVTRFAVHCNRIQWKWMQNFIVPFYGSIEYLSLSTNDDDEKLKLSTLFSMLSQMKCLTKLELESLPVMTDFTDVNLLRNVVKMRQNQFDFTKSASPIEFHKLKSLILTRFIIDPEKAELFSKMFPTLENLVLDYPRAFCAHMVEGSTWESRNFCEVCPGKVYTLMANIKSIRLLVIKVEGKDLYRLSKCDMKMNNFMIYKPY